MATYEVNLTVTGTITVPDPAPLDAITVTVGTSGDESGFSVAGEYGAVNPAVSAIFGNDVLKLCFDPGGSASFVRFNVLGEHSNAGFETMEVGDAVFARADAVFEPDSGETTWRWEAADTPFVGTAVDVVFK